MKKLKQKGILRNINNMDFMLAHITVKYSGDKYSLVTKAIDKIK